MLLGDTIILDTLDDANKYRQAVSKICFLQIIFKLFTTSYYDNDNTVITDNLYFLEILNIILLLFLENLEEIFFGYSINSNIYCRVKYLSYVILY